MQQNLKQIQAFVGSPQCLFNMDSLDYPTLWQQQLILSYFNIRNILKKPHNIIIRQLHSSSLEQVSQGFLYMMLLDKKNEQILLPYMMVLKVETWGFMAQNFQILLRDNADIIHERCLQNVVILLNQLISYNMCTSQLIIYTINLINCYDLTAQSQALSNNILKYFYDKLEENANLSKEFIFSLCYYLFPKILKITTHFNEQFCLKILSHIWRVYTQNCLQIKNTIVSIIDQSSYYLKVPFFVSLYNSLKQSKQGNVKDQLLRQKIQISFLPRKTQSVIQYLLKENSISTSQIKYQLLWLQKTWIIKKFNESEILIDLSKFLTLNSLYLQKKIYILQWIIKRSSTIHPQLFQRVKQSIFYNWFVSTSFETITVTIFLLAHFLYTDTRLSIQLLSYIFKYRSSDQQKLRNIFQQANRLNYLKVQAILSNKLIPESLQAVYYEIIQQPKPQVLKNTKFNPEPIPKTITTQQTKIKQQPKYFTSKSQKSSQILLQQQFAAEFDICLKNMLDLPNYENFVEFFKKLYKAIAANRTQDKDLANLYAQEGAKIIYVCYNNEFEDFHKIIEPHKSVINYMISILLKEWHQVTHKVESIKMILKKICQQFCIGEIVIWYYFFMQFQFGGGNNRQFKNWIVPKDKKAQYVIKAVQTVLGKPSNEFRNRVYKYMQR